ncbi:mammalian ependymin-related protein 1-like [Mercenaria mercenaria]|uniref:mammalian ependymin-related protein 1-like n=1 Tax=Mercenaria mercenaria TaxID=6596 RepID=UPI00234E481A|nr:mammalian ependymin-related protein 1-like [Mercenaria mercenaria]
MEICKDIFRFYLIYLLVHNSSEFLLGHKEYQNFTKSQRNVLTTTENAGSICCTHGQWEANAYLNVGTTMSMNNETVYFFYNGSGNVAFDKVNQRAYVNYQLTAFSPIIPTHYRFKTTKIFDFVKGIMYEIDEQGKCAKENSEQTLQIVCIPQSANQLSQGVFGGENVSTYQFSKKDFLEEITTVTVLQNGSYCETVSLSYAFFSDDPDTLGGSVYDLDVVDLSHGIKDPSIFVPPKSCDT